MLLWFKSLHVYSDKPELLKWGGGGEEEGFGENIAWGK